MFALGRLRALLRVALPVAAAAVLVSLAIVNIALVKTSETELDDGVLWRLEGTNVVAVAIDPGHAGDRAGLQLRDVLLLIDGREVRSPNDVITALHTADSRGGLTYVVQRASAELPVTLQLTTTPGVSEGLYFSLALVGILSIVVGTSVRLRRPNDLATLHFFWLAVAFVGALAFTPSGRYDQLDYFFEWADLIARLALPPLFLHFALVFPERPHAWLRTSPGRAVLPALYLPAIVLGLWRIGVVTRGLEGTGVSADLERIERYAYAYLALCLIGGLALMTRALTRLRSVTARRQLRWIVWGSSVGAVPFVALYVVPFIFGHVSPYSEYTAVLLGCVPLAFASAIVRYRLMDIEVIIKKALVIAAVVLLLAAMYGGTLQLVSLILGGDRDRSSFWALLATLIVALVAPWLWNAIQAALDRLYYRERYDYRRALVSFARALNSDLDLGRLSSRLVERVRETLGIDRIALFLVADAGRLAPVAAEGFEGSLIPAIEPGSALGQRLRVGQTVAVDDPLPARRLMGEEAALWRDAGLFSFVPCTANDTTIAVIATGRRPDSEPLSSEDMALLGAVAAQAATALENARLYGELGRKAHEIEQLHQFSDSVVESLTDGLIVVDLDDRVLRWNRRMEQLVGLDRAAVLNRPLTTCFDRAFLDALQAARREAPVGTALYRAPLEVGSGEHRRTLLVNTAVAPFHTDRAVQAGWIIVLEDVTDRANLEEQLRLSEKMAAIGLLAAGVAHEVNTPLTGISSFTQMLLERSDPGDQRRPLLEKIEQQTFRAAKIVNSLLNLARPSGKETGPVDLNLIVTDVLALLEHQFRMSQIQVRRQLTGQVVIRGVEYKLQQVFLNLFLNARDAMPNGGWLSVTTGVEGGDAVVEVADSGVGIPAEHIGRIYDPFFTTKPEGRGTGLGLSVTYGIVKEHGGTLTCDSDPRQGTRFRLVLPALDRSPAVMTAAR
jgi:PAS domain S-box-containing protein